MHASTARGRPRVLCVDDEPMVLNSLAATLRKRFEIIPASSATEALDLIDHDPAIRVVVSDYRMPGMNGGAFLGHVQKRFPAIVRILLSGASAEDEMSDRPELAFRFLTKPCARDTLIDAIEAALVESTTSPSEADGPPLDRPNHSAFGAEPANDRT